jgi:cytoskeletal protein RodZ
MAINSYIHHHGEGHGTQKELKDKMPSAQEFYTNDSEAESASFPLLRALFFISLLLLLGLLAYWGYSVYTVQPAENSPSSFNETFSPIPGTPLQEEQADGASPDSGTAAEQHLADYTPHGEPVAGTATDLAQAPIPAEMGTASSPAGAENTAPVVPGMPAGTVAEAAAKTAETNLASETTVLSPAPLTINPVKQKIDLNAAEYALKAEFLEPTWLKIEIDGNRIREYTFKAGDHLSWRAQKSLRLTVGNAGGVSLTLNGEQLPPLGPSGKTETLTLPKEVP